MLIKAGTHLKGHLYINVNRTHLKGHMYINVNRARNLP